MAINAHEKILVSIFSNLKSYKLESEREIKDVDELRQITTTSTGINYIKKIIL